MKFGTIGVAGSALAAMSLLVANADPVIDTYETVTYTDWVCRAVPPTPPPPPPPSPPCDNGGTSHSYTFGADGSLSFVSSGFTGFGCDGGFGGLSGIGGFQLDGGSRTIDECREGFQREPFETTETTRTCISGFDVEGARTSWGAIISPNTTSERNCTE